MVISILTECGAEAKHGFAGPCGTSETDGGSRHTQYLFMLIKATAYVYPAKQT